VTEERGTTSRKWYKVFPKPWLHGSIRWQLDAAERGTWADLLAWAAECNHGGLISDNDGRALPRSFIANQLNIEQTLLDRTIAKCKAEGRIKVEPEEGAEAIVITISNWNAYQSEYERQKPYREQKKQRDTGDASRFLNQKYKDNVKK